MRMGTGATVDDMGAACKVAESVEAARAGLPGAVICARWDGRCFSRYTEKAERPYDWTVQLGMETATAQMVEDLRPTIAYTQSDEISGVWLDHAPFGGKFQKIASVGASIISTSFNRTIRDQDSQSVLLCKTALFDGRAWQVASREEAFDVLRWREADATKNSVSQLARVHFSAKQLHGKKSKEMRAMLEEIGVVWGESQTHFKRGIFLQRVTETRTLTEDERARIPEAHRPAADATFERSAIKRVEIESLSKVPNAIDILLPMKGPP